MMRDSGGGARAWRVSPCAPCAYVICDARAAAQGERRVRDAPVAPQRGQIQRRKVSYILPGFLLHDVRNVHTAMKQSRTLQWRVIRRRSAAARRCTRIHARVWSSTETLFFMHRHSRARSGVRARHATSGRGTTRAARGPRRAQMRRRRRGLGRMVRCAVTARIRLMAVDIACVIARTARRW
jgi:hypothetical protein